MIPSLPQFSKDVSPRKKKNQISFAQSSFKGNNEGQAENEGKISDDVQFLYNQLRMVSM